MRELFWDKEGNKIMSKAGAIFCCCTCCSYPWPNADGSLYPDVFLPDTVTYKGETLTHDSPYHYQSATYSISLGMDDWELFGDTDEPIHLSCLILGGVEDQFEDTYSLIVHYAIVDPYSFTATCTVTRVDTCTWKGTYTTDFEGNCTANTYNVTMRGANGDAGGLWFFDWEAVVLNLDDFTCSVLPITSMAKPYHPDTGMEPQKDPTGNYTFIQVS